MLKAQYSYIQEKPTSIYVILLEIPQTNLILYQTYHTFYILPFIQASVNRSMVNKTWRHTTLLIPWYPVANIFAYPTGPPGTHSTKCLWAPIPNLVQIHVVLMSKLRIRFGHYFAHATTAELTWHVENCDQVRSSQTKKSESYFELWDHKPFVKWVIDVIHGQCKLVGRWGRFSGIGPGISLVLSPAHTDILVCIFFQMPNIAWET